MPCSTRGPSRSVRTALGAPSCRWKSANRRTPRKASRRTSKLHFSPTTARVPATEHRDRPHETSLTCAVYPGWVHLTNLSPRGTVHLTNPGGRDGHHGGDEAGATGGPGTLLPALGPPLPRDRVPPVPRARARPPRGDRPPPGDRRPRPPGGRRGRRRR